LLDILDEIATGRCGWSPDLPDRRDHLSAAAKPRWVVRNSCGPGWEIKGYFTLPSAFGTDDNLASEFWTVPIVQ